MRGIVLQLGDKSICFPHKSNGIMRKKQTRKSIVPNAFFSLKQSKGGFVPILLKSQSTRKAFYLVDLCKQKGIKKGCFYERSIPNFRDNKKITIKYYSVI